MSNKTLLEYRVILKDAHFKMPNKHQESWTPTPPLALEISFFFKKLSQVPFHTLLNKNKK